MGVAQLVARSTGQVILQGFFNDIHAALEGDVVGRDASGNAIAGNSLGTQAYPWGAAYITDLILNGSALDVSQIESLPYKINSGRVRSGSNQPVFIVPAGGALTFSVKGATTPLSLQIAGVAASITTDITVAGTAAPTSNHTATVNDGTAASQAATKTWGEYGSSETLGAFYKAITVDAMGSSVSARAGSLQAFKKGSAEYFLAFIDNTTTLQRCFRGFFFDSSDAPIKRLTLADNDVLTLMNLGWVFADANGTTVDVIFTGAGVNNTPTFGAVAPSSPASGDYWYDSVNSVWKRYNGSSFVSTSRIPIGLVVCDGTNCVAARSFDFFALCRTDNTMEVSRVSNTQMQAVGIMQRISVHGARIDFGSNRPIWDTASHLAATSDRYNAAVTASLDEYFYLSDKGELKISDIQPYYRPDLLGWYHPYNPWRAVARLTPDGSANFPSSITSYNIYNYRTNTPGQLLGSDLSVDLELRGLPTVRSSSSASARPLVVSPTASPGLMILRGGVNPDGTVRYGEGFASSKSATGVYIITPTVAFADQPAISALCDGGGLYIGGNLVLSSSFRIESFNAAGVASDSYFSFTAIGARA